MNTKTIYAKDVKSGDKVNEVFLAADKSLAYSQKGSPYLNLRLRDKTGDLDGKVWDNALSWDKAFKKGDLIRIQARALSFKNAVQLSIIELRKVEDGEVDLGDYFQVARGDLAQMFAALLDFCGQVKSPCLAALLRSFFEDETLAALFRRAPAAKAFHHNYIGGLLEHTLSVVRLTDRAAAHYPGVNRDLLITGALLHDIGKIHEFSYDRIVEYSDEGRLVGHIVMGVEMIDRRIAAIPDFPAQTAMELRHLILSHHGVLEYGSPKRPKTLEALIVHHIDNMDANVNAFQETIRGARGEESDWTPYHRLFDRYIYKGRPSSNDSCGGADVPPEPPPAAGEP
ncbi:MAG: HD domain-containing protein [Deltaproteobacteria bacterium]|nr:HD domain-containing protein [Deltaproteobacteria bacterium]